MTQLVSGCAGVVGEWTKGARGGFTRVELGARRGGSLLERGVVIAVESGDWSNGVVVVAEVESGGVVIVKSGMSVVVYSMTMEVRDEAEGAGVSIIRDVDR